MNIFTEIAETITEQFSQKMENLQEIFANYLHSNLRTFLNNTEVLKDILEIQNKASFQMVILILVRNIS